MKNITKRNGKTAAYNRQKIALAMQKSFVSVHQDADDARIEELLKQVEAEMQDAEGTSVESIQDTVEQVLMKNGEYAAAKSYILYRQMRTQKREIREHLCNAVEQEDILPVLACIQKDFPD